MTFKVIKGEFVPEAGRPDGDSMRFRPDDPTPLFMLQRRGRGPKVNDRNGTVQLRFEGIDTMESKANVQYSAAATASNLELCGVAEGTGLGRGYILTNQIGPNGRPISFVFAGEAPEDDGSDTYLDSDRLRTSVNYQQIERGHAYPLFYDTLYTDLRQTLAELVVKTREQKLNIWQGDATMTGAQYSGTESLELMPPIFPKLWRRLDSYSKNRDVANNQSLTEFYDYLDILREERVFIISEGKVTGFDNIINIEGNTIALKTLPEDLIIISA